MEWSLQRLPGTYDTSLHDIYLPRASSQQALLLLLMNGNWASETAQRVKTLAAEAGNLSSVPFC